MKRNRLNSLQSKSDAELHKVLKTIPKKRWKLFAKQQKISHEVKDLEDLYFVIKGIQSKRFYEKMERRN